MMLHIGEIVKQEGWTYKDQHNDPVIEMIKNCKCDKCGAKSVFCDCWIEEICDKCSNYKIACTC